MIGESYTHLSVGKLRADALVVPGEAQKAPLYFEARIRPGAPGTTFPEFLPLFNLVARGETFLQILEMRADGAVADDSSVFDLVARRAEGDEVILDGDLLEPQPFSAALSGLEPVVLFQQHQFNYIPVQRSGRAAVGLRPRGASTWAVWSGARPSCRLLLRAFQVPELTSE